MKRLLLAMFYFMAEDLGAASPALLPTKLDELNAKLLELQKDIAKQVPGTKEQMDAITAVMAQQKLIDAEHSNIKKLQFEQAEKDKRNARVALVDSNDTTRDAYNAWVKANPAPKVQFAKDGITQTPEYAVWIASNNEANKPYAAAREALINLVIGATAKPSNVASNGVSDSKPRGTVSTEIHDLFMQYKASGKTVAESKQLIEKAGYARGTTGSVATAMINAGELSK